MTVLALILLVGGAVFMVIAAVGIVRMPDLYMRMSSTTKASIFGLSMMLFGVALTFGTFAVTSKVVAMVAFLMLTSPVAAHMIGRAAYFDGVPFWKGMGKDELKEHREDKTAKKTEGNTHGGGAWPGVTRP